MLENVRIGLQTGPWSISGGTTKVKVRRGSAIGSLLKFVFWAYAAIAVLAVAFLWLEVQVIAAIAWLAAVAVQRLREQQPPTFWAVWPLKVQ